MSLSSVATRIRRIAPMAQADIEEQARYFSERSRSLVDQFLAAVNETFDALLQAPEMGNPNRLPHLTTARIRTWTIRDYPHYMVFYRAITDGIEIVRVTCC